MSSLQVTDSTSAAIESMTVHGDQLQVQISSSPATSVHPYFAPYSPPYFVAPAGMQPCPPQYYGYPAPTNYNPDSPYFNPYDQQWQQPLPEHFFESQSPEEISHLFEQSRSDSGLSSPFYSHQCVKPPVGLPEPPVDESQEVEDIMPGIAGIRLAEPDAPKPVDEYLSRNMHLKWDVTFRELFNKNCHMGTNWVLEPVFDPPTTNRHRLFHYHDTAKVRFSCYDCGKSWTSVKGNVVFWISKDNLRNEGRVQFKLYGQKCTECNPEYYEHAIWYEEEVERVLRNLYNKVIALYYGVKQQPKETNVRWAHPRQPHNPENCSACADGVCSSQRRQGNRSRHNSRQHQLAQPVSKPSQSQVVAPSQPNSKSKAPKEYSSAKTTPMRGFVRQRSLVEQ